MASKYLLAKIKNENIEFKPAEKKRFAVELKQFNGKEVLVEIPDRFKIRTLQQNRYYRGVVCALVSDFTGFTNEEIHQFFKTKFLSYRRTVKGKTYDFTKSTTELNWKEMTDYIEQIRQYVRESPTLMTVVIPDPDPEYMYKTNVRIPKKGKN